MAEAYAPALRARIDDRERCPPELLLFFHNVGWTERVRVPEGALLPGVASDRAGGRSGGGARPAELPLIELLEQGHRAALAEVERFGSVWAEAEADMRAAGDSVRFEGVRARLAQQLVDARTFSAVATAFYRNISGIQPE